MAGRVPGVVLGPGAHHYGQHVVTESEALDMNVKWLLKTYPRPLTKNFSVI